MFVGANLVSWSSKRQPVISHYNVEARYRVVGLWPTALPRPPGSDSFFRSSRTPSSAPPSSIAKMSEWSIAPPIPCNISARSTCRSTFTLSTSLSLSAIFGFSASRPLCSLPISSTRDLHLVFSLSFDPISTSVHDRVVTAWGVRILLGLY